MFLTVQTALIKQQIQVGSILSYMCYVRRHLMPVLCHHLHLSSMPQPVEKVKALCATWNISSFSNDADAAGQVDQPTWHRGSRATNSRGHDPPTQVTQKLVMLSWHGKAAAVRREMWVPLHTPIRTGARGGGRVAQGRGCSTCDRAGACLYRRLDAVVSRDRAHFLRQRKRALPRRVVPGRAAAAGRAREARDPTPHAVRSAGESDASRTRSAKTGTVAS